VNFEGNPLAPEMSKGYEAGVKTELAEKRLQTTLAFFDVTKDNVATPDPSNPLNTITTGAERSRGVEFDMLGQIVTGWNVIASYSNINAITTADSVIRVGNSLYNSPKNSGSIWTTYAFQDAALKGWDVGGGVQFVGTRFGDNANTYTAPAYTVFNATIAYRQEKWRAAINVKNLFDRYYIADTQNARDYSNDVGQPRTVIGSLTYSF
jgi:iron complex outermembrane receptor protein